MIKFTVKSMKIMREGEGEGGHWISRGIQFQEPVKVFEQSGEEHNFTSGSTFDTMASAMLAGEVWEAEAETTPAKEAGKFYLNLKKLNKVGTAQVNPPTTPATPSGMSKEAPTGFKPDSGRSTPPIEINGAARGMAVNVITELIVASTPERKLLSMIFGDKAQAMQDWYKRQLLGIAEIGD